MKRSLLWFTFKDARGHRWEVFAATRQTSNALRDYGGGGPSLGICFKKRRRIYIDVRHTQQEVFETTLHECLHAAAGPMSLPGKWEEDIVEALSSQLWPVLRTAKMKFPPLPPAAAKLLKKSA